MIQKQWTIDYPIFVWESEAACINFLGSWNWIITIYIYILFFSSQACLPYIKQSKNGHILNISPPLNMKAIWFQNHPGLYTIFRSSLPELFLGKVVLKICSKFTGEQPWWISISIKLQSSFIEIALRHVCSPENL